MAASIAIYGVVAVLFLIYSLDSFFCRRRHANEPHYVRPKVPLIGHLIGLSMYGSKYYAMIRWVCMRKSRKIHHEADRSPRYQKFWTTGNLHIAHLLVSLVRDQLTPFIPSDHATCTNIILPAVHSIGCSTMNRDLFRDTRTALALGPHLDYQNLMTGQSMQRIVDALNTEMAGAGKENFAIYKWITHVFSVAPSDGIYGKNNPFRDPQVTKDFWQWVSSAKKLTAGVPRFLLRNDIQARDRVFKAFEKYWQSDWSDAAEIIQTRKRLYDREGVSLQDQAGNQASFNIALLGNTVPTAFWALYHIIQHPHLVRDIRSELSQNAVDISKASGQSKFVLDVSAIRTQCPLLLSSYQKSQRTKSQHANIRQALEDTTIESPTTGAQFFFAKGQYIQMPSGPIHKNTSIWGPTAQDFDPYRFMKENAVTRKGESYAFMPWGSAPHLCPARQFASTEVMLFLAFMVLRFDFTPSGTSSEWIDPGHDDAEFTTLPPPKTKVLLNIRQRDGWQGTWELRCGDSSKKIPLASG